jgi:hypothetical protein
MHPTDFMAMLHTIPFVRHYLPVDRDGELFDYMGIYVVLEDDHGAPEPMRMIFTILYSCKDLNPQ